MLNLQVNRNHDCRQKALYDEGKAAAFGVIKVYY